MEGPPPTEVSTKRYMAVRWDSGGWGGGDDIGFIETWADALERAAKLVRLGYGGPGKQIWIEEVVTRRWRLDYEPKALDEIRAKPHTQKG